MSIVITYTLCLIGGFFIGFFGAQAITRMTGAIFTRIAPKYAESQARNRNERANGKPFPIFIHYLLFWNESRKDS